MEKRVQRHLGYDEKKASKRTRTSKNKYLYDDINNKIGYEEITNLTNEHIDLSAIIGKEATGEKEDNYLLPKYDSEESKEEDKIYDINSVLEEAKKNRIKYDELEKKRKLRENEYATLANINNKEVYIKKERHNEIDEEELANLINTITSHTLLDEIKEAEKKSEDEEILSDLLATNVDLNLEECIAKEFTEQEKSEEIDDSFYTKSMELSEQDFEFAEELEKDKKLKVKIVIIIALIFIVLAIIAFVILRQKGII